MRRNKKNSQKRSKAQQRQQTAREKQLRVTREAARARPFLSPTAAARESGRLDRQHLLDLNLKEIRRADVDAPAGHVILVCDSQDTLARDLIKHVKGISEQDLRAHEAPFRMAKTIYTTFLSLPREGAVDLLAATNPSVSEILEALPSDSGRPVLAVASAGTSMMILSPDGTLHASAPRRRPPRTRSGRGLRPSPR